MPPADKKPDESQVQTSAATSGADTQAAPAASDAVAGAPAADVQADPAAGAPDVPKGVAVVTHPADPKAGASFGGQSYEADENGFLVVPLDAVVDLMSHGFVMVKKG